jgi:flagellar biosynthetic protein FliR
MDIFDLIQSKFFVWAMALSRIGGLMISAPFYSGWFIPTSVKVWLSVFLSWLIVYTTDYTIPMNTPLVHLVIGMVNNFILGTLIGFIAYMLISAVMSASGIFSIQMGFMIASSFDPSVPEVPLLGNVVYLLAIYIFVSLKGHLILYKTISESFERIPPMMYGTNFSMVEFLIKKSGEIFVVALQLGMTIIAFMLVVTVLLGIISRLMPQLNVFMVGIPLKILIGLYLFLGMIPIWAEAFEFLVGKVMNYSQALISR